MIKIPGIPPLREERLQVGRFMKNIIEALDLDIPCGTPIFLSENNREHIREHHPDAYFKYFDCISEIIAYPDYVGIAGIQAASIEYIKCFEVDSEYVNVAVRATKKGTYYVRSMFVIEEGKLNDYVEKGKLKRLTNP